MTPRISGSSENFQPRGALKSRAHCLEKRDGVVGTIKRQLRMTSENLSGRRENSWEEMIYADDLSFQAVFSLLGF